ncbi:MAG: hypothetical protein GY804_14695 [Alphaproteobacteria bacterium]|nr:hypothetical protein [Alphaproteobacteria bacterium]
MAELKRPFAEAYFYQYSREKRASRFSFVKFCIRCFRLFVGISLLLYGLISALIFLVEGAILVGIALLCLPLLGIRLVMKKRIMPEVKDDQFIAYRRYR